MNQIIQRRRAVGDGVLVLALSIGVLLFLTLRNPASAAGSSQTFILNGDMADALFSNATTSASVFAGRSGNQQQPQTDLFYLLLQTSPCCSVEDGAGPIPNGDLTGGATSHLSLNTNTCSDPGFSTFLGPCGSIAIYWQNNNFYSESVSGSHQKDFGPVTFLTSGQSTTTSASASESVLGSTFPSTSGEEMGTFHNANILVQPH